jgi:predicted CoA-binding protein
MPGTADVAVLGASRKRHRYSNRAIHALREHGYRVLPVNPAYDEIEGLPVAHSLADVPRGIHTLTVYVGPQHIGPLIEAIVELAPQRVILNPGAESAELEAELEHAGIPYLEACTLVMLGTGQFATAA